MLDLTSDILIPLPLYQPSAPKFFWHDVKEYEGSYQFAQTLLEQGFKTPRIVDLNMLFQALLGILNTQKRLFKKTEWKESFHFKVQLLNAWRTCPFVDVPSVLTAFKEHGVPVCLDEVVVSPPATEPDTFREMPIFENLEPESLGEVLQSIVLFDEIAIAYGLPRLAMEDVHAMARYSESLLQASKRYLDRQARRMQNSSS